LKMLYQKQVAIKYIWMISRKNKGKEKLSPKRKSKYNAAKALGKDSNLEVLCDKMLTEAGIVFEYNTRHYMLSEGFKFCSYDGHKDGMKQKCIGRPITYSPDFLCPDQSWIIETKGMVTEGFQIRWKLFKKYCSIHLPNTLLIICHNKKEIAEAITLIQSHLNQKKNATSA